MNFVKATAYGRHETWACVFFEITYDDAFLAYLSGCSLPSLNSKLVSFTLLLSWHTRARYLVLIFSFSLALPLHPHYCYSTVFKSYFTEGMPGMVTLVECKNQIRSVIDWLVYSQSLKCHPLLSFPCLNTRLTAFYMSGILVVLSAG